MLPRLLRDFGDVDAVLSTLAPRGVLATAPRGQLGRRDSHVTVIDQRFTSDARILLDWLDR